MLQKLVSFFMSIVAFFMSLFGIGGGSTDPEPTPTPVTDPDPIVYLSENTLSYGSDANQTLDLYFPAGKTGDVGLILFIHGGAWVTGSKESYLIDALQWQSRGYVTATMNYRFLGNGVLPSDELNDITAALRAIKTVAAQKGVTVSKTVMVGISAGAHLALLYAYTKQSEAPVAPVAVISSSAPTDFTDPAFMRSGAGELLAGTIGVNSETLAALLETGVAEAFIPALTTLSPAKQVTSRTVPTLIAHGQQDTIVPYSNAVTLDAALTQNSVPHDFIPFPNSGHALLNDPDCTLQFQTRMAQYIGTYLG